MAFGNFGNKKFGAFTETTPFGGKTKSPFGSTNTTKFGGTKFGNRNTEIDLFRPIGNEFLPPNVVSGIKAMIESIHNDIDRVIVKLITEHQSRTSLEEIVKMFAPVKLKGCSINIIYKENLSMSPSFSISKNLVNTGVTSFGKSFGGAKLGGTLKVNGVTVTDESENKYAMDATVNKMNKIIEQFTEIADIFAELNLDERVEVRTRSGIVNWISDTGNLILTPSTFIMNDNKNDAKKLSSRR